MILGIDQLLELVHEKKLVENLSERELNNPEGAGFDLRIGELYEVAGSGFLHIENRKTPELKLIAKYGDGKSAKIKLEPNKAYVMKTIEKVNTPDNLLGLIFPRSTLYRSGILLSAGVDDPGYSGELSFGMFNLGKDVFELEMGARVAHIIFFEVKGDAGKYTGKWQGGRVSADKEEKQI
jgi:deoxycytidine triphosphate deaminase